MIAADSNWYSSSWLYEARNAHTRIASDRSSVPWNFARALAGLKASPGAELLDVGCAEGHFLHLARKAGFQVTGLDFNPDGLEIARRVFGISSVYQYSVEELGGRFPGRLFDAITIFEVLEHTADPLHTIVSVNRLLKPGGQLFVSVPGARRWPRLFHPEVDTPPHHLTLWTEEALRRLLERAGFRVHAIEAKPLAGEDLGMHLKWRLVKLLRGGASAKALNAQTNGRSFHPNGGEKTKEDHAGKPGAAQSDLMRRAAMAGLAPLCGVLRLHPRAGGFTLLASCEKAL